MRESGVQRLNDPAPVAQRIEQQPSNLSVVGSIPTGGAKHGSDSVQSQRGRLGDLQHRAGAAPRDTLGVRFTERPSSDPAKRPVREIVGVDPRLNQRWSTRRAHIRVRQGELAVAFQRDHGRPPTPVEALRLAQQATLETREAKHEPRSLPEQRKTWRAEAEAVLGGPDAVTSTLQSALNPTPATTVAVDTKWVAGTTNLVLAAMEQRRSTWQMWHGRAEAQRHVRIAEVATEQVSARVDLLVDEVLHSQSVALAPPDDGIEEPEVLRRVDGSSVYTVAGANLYTSQRILDAGGA